MTNSFPPSPQRSPTSTSTSLHRQPTTRMLKDFLYDDPPSSSHPTPSLQRSRSRSRAAVLSLQKLLSSALKSLHRISPPQPATLQRSLSKRLLTKFRHSDKKPSGSGDGTAVKVKDILRWRSFQDNKSPPSDSPEPTASTTSSEQSYCEQESDFSFTAEELPRWSGEGKKWKDEVHADVEGDVVVDVDPVRETIGVMDVPEMGQDQEECHQQAQEDDLEFEEDKEQHSPVSVLNSPFRDEVSDEEATSSFDQSLANVERTKQRLLQSIQWLENLAGVDEHSSEDGDSDTEDEYKEQGKDIEDKEEVTRENENSVVVAKSRDYMFKVFSRLRTKWQGVESKDCLKEMDREGQWVKFGGERQEVGYELEGCLLQDMVDEVLVDLFG